MEVKSSLLSRQEEKSWPSWSRTIGMFNRKRDENHSQSQSVSHQRQSPLLRLDSVGEISSDDDITHWTSDAHIFHPSSAQTQAHSDTSSNFTKMMGSYFTMFTNLFSEGNIFNAYQTGKGSKMSSKNISNPVLSGGSTSLDKLKNQMMQATQVTPDIYQCDHKCISEPPFCADKVLTSNKPSYMRPVPGMRSVTQLGTILGQLHISQDTADRTAEKECKGERKRSHADVDDCDRIENHNNVMAKEELQQSAKQGAMIYDGKKPECVFQAKLKIASGVSENHSWAQTDADQRTVSDPTVSDFRATCLTSKETDACMPHFNRSGHMTGIKLCNNDIAKTDLCDKAANTLSNNNSRQRKKRKSRPSSKKRQRQKKRQEGVQINFSCLHATQDCDKMKKQKTEHFLLDDLPGTKQSGAKDKGFHSSVAFILGNSDSDSEDDSSDFCDFDTTAPFVVLLEEDFINPFEGDYLYDFDETDGLHSTGDPDHPLNLHFDIFNKHVPKVSSSPEMRTLEKGCLFELEENDYPSFHSDTSKRVHFPDEEHIATVYEITGGDSDECRKGPWEAYAADRCRFQRRIAEVNEAIGYCFDPQHRQQIFKYMQGCQINA